MLPNVFRKFASIRARVLVVLGLTALSLGAISGCDFSIVEEPIVRQSLGVSIKPSGASLVKGETLQLRAVVRGTKDTAVRWNLVTGVGSIDEQTGLYTAPASVDVEFDTAIVRVTLLVDTSIWATGKITVYRDSTGGGGPITLALSAPKSLLQINETMLLTATVTGSSNAAVTWSVVEGPGTIDANGLYRAPSNITADAVKVIVEALANASPSVTERLSFWVTKGEWTPAGKLCFEKDVLPIFVSNCAMAGCHNANHEYDFRSYADIRENVEPGRPDDHSEIIERLEETDPSKKMPPGGQLPQAQIDIIKRWITEGARNTICPDTSATCDTVSPLYSKMLRPLIEKSCSCHKMPATTNGVDLATYENVKELALSGRLHGALSHADGYVPMPMGGKKLSDCELSQILAWINRGAPED